MSAPSFPYIPNGPAPEVWPWHGERAIDLRYEADDLGGHPGQLRMRQIPNVCSVRNDDPNGENVANSCDFTHQKPANSCFGWKNFIKKPVLPLGFSTLVAEYDLKRSQFHLLREMIREITPAGLHLGPLTINFHEVQPSSSISEVNTAQWKG